MQHLVSKQFIAITEENILNSQTVESYSFLKSWRDYFRSAHIKFNLGLTWISFPALSSLRLDTNDTIHFDQLLTTSRFPRGLDNRKDPHEWKRDKLADYIY